MNFQSSSTERIQFNELRKSLLESVRLVLPKKTSVALVHSDLSSFRVKKMILFGIYST